MPELPEVETIGRELKPLIVGRTITDAWLDWPRVVRHPDPDGLIAGVRGREIVDVTRRGKWLVLALAGDAALAIQVKMTGQLFVLAADLPRDPHIHFLLDLDDGQQLRMRDVRKFGRVGLYRRDEAGLLRGDEETADVFAAF